MSFFSSIRTFTLKASIGGPWDCKEIDTDRQPAEHKWLCNLFKQLYSILWFRSPQTRRIIKPSS